MLSLKESPHPTSNAQPTLSTSRMLDLPSELLDQIIDILASDDYRTENLCPLSLVSRRFRTRAQASLFKSINVVLSQRRLQRGETFILWLLCTPRIRGFVRHVAVQPPLRSTWGDDNLESARCAKLLPMLSNLESLWLYALNEGKVTSKSYASISMTLPLVKALTFTRPLHLAIASLALSYVPEDTHTWQLNQSELHSHLELCDSISVSLVHKVPGGPHRCGSLKSLKSVFARIKSLNVVQLADDSEETLFRQGTRPNHLTGPLLDATPMTTWNTLEELHVTSKYFLPLDTITLGKSFSNTFKRLSVEGPGDSFNHFFRHVGSLSSLESLKIRCTSLMLEVSGSPLSHLSKLRDLELELVSSQIRIGYFSNPGLRHLKVHFPEHMARRPEESLIKYERTPGEIASLTRIFPLLENVEVDVGDISSLWVPTAVAGVDVDVSVYSVLASLARLPRLRKLRLYPSYCKRDRMASDFPSSLFRQPLSDEQAIKIFNYLKNQCVTLQEVAISTDNKFASRARRVDFHAMSWTMHTKGPQTILVTRQAWRNYEQRQTWVGERRLTTEIRRFAYLKPYVPQSPGWTL